VQSTDKTNDIFEQALDTGRRRYDEETEGELDEQVTVRVSAGLQT
jgi:hypothetical protein